MGTKEAEIHLEQHLTWLAARRKKKKKIHNYGHKGILQGHDTKMHLAHF